MADEKLMALIQEGRRLHALARDQEGRWPRYVDEEPEVVGWCERHLSWLLDSLEAFIVRDAGREARERSLLDERRQMGMQITRLCKGLERQRESTGLVDAAERVLAQRGIPSD